MKKFNEIEKNLSKKTVKRASIIFAMVLVGIILYKSPIVQNKVTANAHVQKTVVVKSGDIKLAVEGTGDIYYDKTSNISSKVSSKVTKIYFKEGDRVKAGDLICEFDDSANQLVLNQSKNALIQNQLANNANAIQAGKLSIKTPFLGQIRDITVNKDDVITRGAPLFTIADTSKLKLSVEFNDEDIKKISLNQPIDVDITSMMQSIKGVITYKSNKLTSTSSGGKLYTVEIQINNPGALLEGMSAKASLETANGTIESVNAANLEYIKKTTVISETGGTVESILIKKNQQVSIGEEVIRIKNDDITINKSIADTKVAGAQIQIASSENQLKDYKIYAPIDGMISKQSIKQGDSVTIGEQITSIEEINVVKVDIDIDEIEISKVAVGQKAELTLDALSETTTNPIQGEVIKIALNGTSKNGVTNFAVTVRVKERQNKLRGGMNVTARIESESVTNVLYVPKEAVKKDGVKQLVMIRDDKTKGIPKEVQVGASNESIIEIKSGLKEGDVIVLPES